MQYAALAGVEPVLRQLAAGIALFRRGDATFGIFRLLSGRMRLVRVTASGTEVAIHTARPGDLFAEASLFSAQYHCDAIALQRCEILVYPKTALMRKLRSDAESLWMLTAELARHVQDLRSRIELRQIRSAPQRVLQFLRLRVDEQGYWQPEGTLKQAAEEIGLTHEALYRALAVLEQEGAIIRAGKQIMLRRNAGSRRKAG